MLANQGACSGEGIVLADHLDSTCAVALLHQGDVGGDVDVGGALGDAGHGLAGAGVAGRLGDVALVLVREGLEALEHLCSGIVSDGAVRRVPEQARPLGDLCHVGAVGLVAEHLVEQGLDARDALAAGRALAAGLGSAGLEQARLHCNGARAGRHGLDAARVGLGELDDLGIGLRALVNQNH